MRRAILRTHLSPGDVLMLTAAVRELHTSYPGEFETDVRTSADALWEGNPRITRLSESDPGTAVIDMHYPLVHQSNQRPYHFIHGYIQHLEKQLKVSIPVTRFAGEVFLTDEERRSPLPEVDLPGHFWIVVAGGKYDFTAKWWNPESYQKVVDHFRGKIAFVQCGEAGHWHPPLNGVVDLVGKTTLRQFVRLMHHAAGVVCPVTFAMHLAAAVETRPDRPKVRPCVVIGGGRESPHWEAYPTHQYISTVGSLSCCEQGGCWKSRCQLVGDGDSKDQRNVCEQPVQITPDLRIPRCMDMITPEDVIRRIEFYLQGIHAPGIRSTDATRLAATNGSSERRPLPVPPRPSVSTASTPRPTRTQPVPPRPRAQQQPRPKPDPPRASGRLPAPVQTAVPSAPHRLLIEFRHGLGDAVQLSILLQHLRHYHPDWVIDLAALFGKQSIGKGLCRDVYIHGQQPGRSAYDQVIALDWHECRSVYTNCPSTKPLRCLQEVFHLTPVLELCHYQIQRSPTANERAREYLSQICPAGTDAKGRYPVVLLHYQGNTSCERKDLTHEMARQVCEAVKSMGQVPVILDWDNRSPLVDQQMIFNPGAGHAVWGGFGTGDVDILAALIEASSLMVGIDSGPLHVAGATSTPTLGVWTQHHPIHYFDLARNVRHLIPMQHASLALGAAAVNFFEKYYAHQVYRDLETDLITAVREVLTIGMPSFVPAIAAEPVAVSDSSPTIKTPAPSPQVPSQRAPRPKGRQKPCCGKRAEELPPEGPPMLTATEYNRQYYEEHKRAGLDYLNFGDWQREYGRWFVESLNLRGKRVLDVGCACGSILRGLGEAAAVVQGCDLSQHMIELGRRKWPDMSPLLHVADAAHLEMFGDQTWEALHSAQVAEHWPPDAVPDILRELARVTVPGGLFFCSLDTEELFARQKRNLETEDPTHVCIRPRAWWLEQLAETGWTDCTAEVEPALKSHPQSFLQRYDWDWFVARREL